MKSRISTVAIMAITMSIFAAAAPAKAGDDTSEVPKVLQWHLNGLNLPHGFTSADFSAAKGLAAAGELRKRWQLEPGWREPQLCAAMRSSAVMEVRNRLALGPGFTESEYKQGAGASRMNDVLASLKLSPHFTEEQLRTALAISATSVHQENAGLPPGAFSFAELAHAEGLNVMRKLAEHYDLDEDFDFEQLAEAAGPRETAYEMRVHGIVAGSTHEEMAAQAGNKEALSYAENQELPPNFTRAQLIEIVGAKELAGYRSIYEIPDNVVLTDKTLTEYFGIWEVQYRRERDLDYTKASGATVEPALSEAHFASMGQFECDSVREEYDLLSGYSESDYADAVGASEVAYMVNTFKLRRRNFTQAELYKAAKFCNFSEFLEHGSEGVYCYDPSVFENRP